MRKEVINYKLGVISLIAFLTYNLSFLIHNYCYADSISSSGLIKNARQYDGQAVVYEGEVIGEVMPRGEFAWVNINDGDNAIGVWAKQELIKDIVYAGSFKYAGDWVAVEGIFHNACAEHGGDLDIHGEKITKIRSGEPLIHLVPEYKKNLAIYLLGALGCLSLILLIRRRRPSRK